MRVRNPRHSRFGNLRYSAVATLNTYEWERENRPPSAGVSDRFGSCLRRFWLFPLSSDGKGQGEGHFVGNMTLVRHLFFTTLRAFS